MTTGHMPKVFQILEGRYARVVNGSDLNYTSSLGLCPRRFKSYCRRSFYFLFLGDLTFELHWKAILETNSSLELSRKLISRLIATFTLQSLQVN